MSSVPKDLALTFLSELRRKIPRHPAQVDEWKISARTTIATIFGDKSSALRDLAAIRWFPRGSPVSVAGAMPSDHTRANQAAVERAGKEATALFNALEQRVRLWEDQRPEATAPIPPLPEPTPTAKLPTGRIFIVHGHDNGIKNAVARYIQKLGLQEIILHEQPNRGQTVIEKFEREAEADFAVVLATADDLAQSQKLIEEAQPDKVPELLEGRARQNVIFELGYFVASLNRSRVMLITDPSTKLPSDLSGVLYTTRANWTHELWRALDEIGHQFTTEQIKQATAIVA